MKDLILLEHKKLWRRNTTKICVLLCFLYVVVLDCVLSYQWFSFGSQDGALSAFDNHFDGYENIRVMQEYHLKWGGTLTDESLQQMVTEYQNLQAAGMEAERYRSDWLNVNSWLTSLWPELADPDAQDPSLFISYVDPHSLTGLYERRQQLIEKQLEFDGQTGAEREYLLQMNAKVQEPFRYEWTEGWLMILGSNNLPMIMAVFVAIVLSTIFAGEWTDNTSSLVLSTRNGWQQVAYAKICAGLTFTLELFFLLASLSVTAQLFFLGTAGWDMPIQIIRRTAVAPMNMLQAEIYFYVFTLFGAIGFAGIVLFLSAAVKNSYAAVLGSLAVVYLPMVLEKYLPQWLQKALGFIPLSKSPSCVFWNNTFCIFGCYIWAPWLLLSIPVLLGSCCLPFAIRKWARRPIS